MAGGQSSRDTGHSSWATDDGVDSLHGEIISPTGTIITALKAFGLLWAFNMACLLAVVIYTNVNNFFVKQTVKDVSSGTGVDPAARTAAACWTLLSVSLLCVLISLYMSYRLHWLIYHTVCYVQKSLRDFYFILLLNLHGWANNFYVDSVSHAMQIEVSRRYYAVEFSPYCEINEAEWALNRVSMRLMDIFFGSYRGSGQRYAPPPHHAEETTVSLLHRLPARMQRLTTSTTRTTMTPNTAAVAVEGESNGLADTIRSDAVMQLRRTFSGPTSAMAELSSSPLVPFRLSLKRRRAAVLLLSFTHFHDVARSDGFTAGRLSSSFISVVHRSVDKWRGYICEMGADRAIISWNAFTDTPGDYIHSALRCGYLYVEEFAKAWCAEAELEVHPQAVGYVGHVVCGTTTEKDLFLCSEPVTLLREVPTLLNIRYCPYVWLGRPPRMRADQFCKPLGSVIGENRLAMTLYALARPAEEPEGSLPKLRVWHSPRWRVFGAEQMAAVQSMTHVEDRIIASPPPLSSSAVETVVAPMPVDRPPLRTIEEFRDRNSTLYYLSNCKLGESKSCSVRLAMSSNGNLVAVKEIRIARGHFPPMRRRRYQREKKLIFDKDKQPDWMGEINIMERLRHTCIVEYISFVETEDKLRIVMEYVGCGNLLTFCSGTACKDAAATPPVRLFLRNVVEGLGFLHRRDIIHGDIKPHNVLVPDSGPCKIADFGISQRTSNIACNRIGGTLFYMAPEVVRGEMSIASDIWSFGIMMAQLLTGRLPWPRGVEAAYLSFEFSCGRDVERVLHGPLEESAMDVFLACTQYDPTKRKTARELLKMPYFSKA